MRVMGSGMKMLVLDLQGSRHSNEAILLPHTFEK